MLVCFVTMLGVRDRSLERGSLILALSLLTLVLGFAVQVVLAAALGVGRRMDVFLVATTLPVLVGTVAISVFPSFMVPLLKAGAATAPDERARLIGRVLCAAALAAALVTLTLVAAAPWLVRILVPGFDAGSADSAAMLLRIMAVGCFFDIVRSVLTGVEYSRERFLLPQLAPSVNHGLLLLSALLLLRPFGLAGLALGWTAGSVAMFAVLARGLRGVPLVPRGGASAGAGRTAIRDLLLPVVVVAMLAQLVPLIDRFVASTLEAGAISSLGYGSKMLEVLLRTVPMAIGLAAFPVLSARVAKEDWQGLADTFDAALHWLVAAVVPVAAMVVVFRGEIVCVLFERGAFDRAATLQVATACGWYAAALVPAAILYLMQNLLLALRRGWALGAVVGGGLLATAGLDLVLSRVLGFEGIAVAFLGVAVLQCAAVFSYLARAWPALMPRRPAALLLQVGVGLIGVLAVVGWVLPAVWPVGSGAPLLRLLAGGIAGLLTYVTLLLAAGNEPVRAVAQRLATRWRKRRDARREGS